MKALLASAVALALLAGTPALAWAQHDPPYQDPHGKKRHKQRAGQTDRSHHAGKRDRNDRRAAAGGRYETPGYASGLREKAERDPARRKYDRGDVPAKYGGGAGGYARGGQGGKYARTPKYDAPGYVPKSERDPARRKYDRDDIPVKYDAYGRGWRGSDTLYEGSVWRSGDMLPAAYAGRRFAIEDYWRLGLDAPPRGHRWVRRGDDAVLVNRRTGVILIIERVVFG